MKGRIYPTQYGWQVRFGEKICRHFPKNNLIGAERYLNFLRYQVDENIFDPRDHQVKANPLGLKKLATQWLKLKKKQTKPRSYANLSRYMKQLCDFMGTKTNVKLIGYPQLEDFLFSDNLKISDKTRANMKSCLRDFFKWVSRRNRIPAPDLPETPFELGWRQPIDIQTQSQIINKVKELSYCINPKIWFAIKGLATYISLRPGELICCLEKEINLSGFMVVSHPKEKTPKIVYLLDEDIEFIKAQPRGLPDMYFFRHPPGIKGARAGQRFGNRYLYKWWKKACDELGIDGVDLYGGTRHSTATALGKICTPEEVRDATGHVSKAFERYFQNRQARALKVTRKIKELRGQIVEFPTNQDLIKEK